MLFTLATPSFLLIAIVNGAALPQRQTTEVEARDFLDDIGSILSNAVPVVESFLRGLAGPAPTDDNVGVSITQYPASVPTSAPPAFTIPGTPLSSGPVTAPTPAGSGPILSLAGPFPSLAPVDPHNPAGIRLPGSPFMVTAPAAAAASAAPARRLHLDDRQETDIEKRIDLDGIVNAVVSALPTAIQDKVAPLIHDVLPGVSAATSSPASPPLSATQNAAIASVTTGPLPTPNAARSLRGETSSMLASVIVIVGSTVLSAAIAL